MTKPEQNARDDKGGPRTRLGTKVVAGIAALSLVASMCPGTVALAYANGQYASDDSPLAVGTANMEAQALSAQGEGETLVDEDTHRMGTGTYRVSRDVTIKPYNTNHPDMYGNAIQIEEGAKVLLYIDEGATLTVTGEDAAEGPSNESYYARGHAAILLPKGSTLTVAGAGTLKARGGRALDGLPGWSASESGFYVGGITRAGRGGLGGFGGGGAGAGIGTNGGYGGYMGGSGNEVRVNGLVKSNVYGNEGSQGGPGYPAKPAGTLIATGTVTVEAEGGDWGRGGGGGYRGKYEERKEFGVATGCGTSGGGGGGGGGGSAYGIGSGGTGGGGGGGGASGNIDGECAFFYGADLDDLWGHGGQGGRSYWGESGHTGDEGASNGGDDTDTSKQYAKAGGAGGSVAEPQKVSFYTFKTPGASAGPTVKSMKSNGEYDSATALPDLQSVMKLGGLAGLVSGGTSAYDGKPHGVSVNNLGNLKDQSDSSAALSAQAEGDGEERSGKVTLEDGTVVSYSIVYYDEKGNALPDEEPVPVKPGQYAAVVTFASENPDYCGDWVEVITITKREVAKPTPAALTFECADWTTGEGKLQEAFAKMGDDYTFVADAKAEDGTASLKAAKDAGEYMACFKLNDPATCQWEGESEDTQEVWVPWSVKLQEFDPNEVTYWGTAHDDATTSLAYTGEPQWVRPWYEYAKDDGGEFPEWLAHWGAGGRPSDKASAAVVYVRGEGDEQGLVGYHTGAGGTLEPVTAAQVYAWANGVDVGGKHVDVESGDTVWYKTGTDGWWVPLAVQAAKPAGAEGSIVARDWAYVDRLGVKDAGAYTAYALFDEGAGFAPTALATATVTVGDDVSGAKVALSKTSYTYNGKAKKPAVTVTLGRKALEAGTDYDVAYKGNVDAGTATVTVTGKGNYYGSAKATFKIAKGKQKISAKKSVGVTVKAKASGEKRVLAKKVTVNLAKKAKASAKTKVAYAKANKAGGKRIAVAKKTGKVTLKKGLAKGTYKVRVKLTAPAGKNYKAASPKTVTLTVRVK